MGALGINALAEFAEQRQYDGYIPVVSAATESGIILKSLNKPVRFVEYHKRWPKSPAKWISMGGLSAPLPKHGDLVIIENDILSGATIEAVIHKIRHDLNPRNIDVLTYNHYMGSYGADHVRNEDVREYHYAGDMPRSDVIGRIEIVSDKLKKLHLKMKSR